MFPKFVDVKMHECVRSTQRINVLDFNVMRTKLNLASCFAVWNSCIRAFWHQRTLEKLERFQFSAGYAMDTMHVHKSNSYSRSRCEFISPTPISLSVLEGRRTRQKMFAMDFFSLLVELKNLHLIYFFLSTICVYSFLGASRVCWWTCKN